MNRFRIAKVIIVFSSLSYLSVTFYEIIIIQKIYKKDVFLNLKKILKNHLETSREEWNQILDLADNNYLKCMGIPHN